MRSVFSWKKFAWRVIILTLGSSLVAVTVNAVRPTPLDWVATTMYEIYQDCPESTVSAEQLELSKVLSSRQNYLVVDTRSDEERKYAPITGSLAIQYDSLFPILKTDIDKILKTSAGRSVLVIGEGSTAKLMADELVSNGLKNIYYLKESTDYLKLVDVKGGK